MRFVILMVFAMSGFGVWGFQVGTTSLVCLLFSPLRQHPAERWLILVIVGVPSSTHIASVLLFSGVQEHSGFAIGYSRAVFLSRGQRGGRARNVRGAKVYGAGSAKSVIYRYLQKLD